MSEVGFDGYSIQDLLTATENLKVLKYIRGTGGAVEDYASLEVGIVFGDKGHVTKAKKILEKLLKRLEKTMAKEHCYFSVAAVEYLTLRVVLSGLGGVSGEIFRNAPAFETEMLKLLAPYPHKIIPPPWFDTKGFDRRKYE